MARKRMLSPSIWEDPTFNTLSRDARLLFIGMISHADDEGYLRADVGSLKRLIFGFDDKIVEPLTRWLAELEDMRSLHFYENEGEKYVHFKKWDTYQKQQKDRVQATAYPKCSVCLAGVEQVRKEVSKEVSKVDKVKLSKVKTASLSLFEDFYTAYPRKVAKKKAQEAWNKINPDETLAKKIIEAVVVQCQSDQWKKDDGKFIPHPTTWLNQERWNDQGVVKAKVAGGKFGAVQSEKI